MSLVHNFNETILSTQLSFISSLFLSRKAEHHEDPRFIFCALTPRRERLNEAARKRLNLSKSPLPLDPSSTCVTFHKKNGRHFLAVLLKKHTFSLKAPDHHRPRVCDTEPISILI